MTQIATVTIRYAKGELGQTETARNWSTRIAEYLLAVTWNKPAPWCAAFACWCIKQAVLELKTPTLVHFGLSTLKLWDRNPDLRVTPGSGVDLSGCLALRNEGACAGHTMIVETHDAATDMLHVISGNTYPGGDNPSREGKTVAEHDIPLSQLAKGYGFVRIA